MRGMGIYIKTISTLLFTFFISVAINAQDRIYKKNKEIIECTIKEVGSEDVKYHTQDVPDDVLLSISIDKIIKIEFANGKQMFFKDNFSDPENYVDQRKNILKISFIESLRGSTSFTLERSLRPGKSIEGSVGIIGLGWDPNNSEGAGGYVGFGIKFLSKPDYQFRKMRYSHILKGFFIKPEVLFSSYKVIPFESNAAKDKVSVFAAGFVLNLGKQWVFDDSFALELFGGIGYGYKSKTMVPQYALFIGDETPLSGKIGLRIGFLY